MAYKCPRCGDGVARASNSMIAGAFGLIGALITAAFGDLACKKCGKIPKGEFPPDVQSQMTRGSITLVVSAVLVFVVAIVALVAISQMGK